MGSAAVPWSQGSPRAGGSSCSHAQGTAHRRFWGQEGVFSPGQIGTGPQGVFAFLCSTEHGSLLGLLGVISGQRFPAAAGPGVQLCPPSRWESPTTGRKSQLCWTVLPQAFKNSPTLFGNVLAKELEEYQDEHPSVTLLQYVDDILIGTASEQECRGATIDLFNFLALAGYRLSGKQAQSVQTTVKYLGLEVSQGKRKLALERKEAICQRAPPRSKKNFTGSANTFRKRQSISNTFKLYQNPARMVDN